MEKRKIVLSVHALVDSLLRTGDIDNRVFNRDTMLLGSAMHASYQKKQGREYLSEVPLDGTFERENVSLTLQGRADGIIVGGKCPIIDEIKSTVSDLDVFFEEEKEWHLGQAKCYALLYLLKNGGDRAQIQLTYLSQKTNEKKTHLWTFEKAELQKDVDRLVDEFLKREEEVFAHLSLRHESAKKLSFPYKTFRKGQQTMAKYIYATIKKGGYFFCEAPTGIGKTMSSLYPAMKAFGATGISKVFFLSAKSSGQESAEKALKLLIDEGLCIRVSTLASKESICLSKGKECNPDSCPFAKNYYSLLPNVRKEALKRYVHFNKENVTKLALEFGVCPFELELDLSFDSDVIVADYNYFIDPFVRLERYFGETSIENAKNFFVLVDEAHNLVDRGRRAYSESLSLWECKKAKQSLKGYPKKGFSLRLGKIQKAIEKNLEGRRASFALEDFPQDLSKGINRFLDAKKELLKEDGLPPLPESVNDFSRKCFRLRYLLENYPELVPYASVEGKDKSIGLLCLDASKMLLESFEKVRGAVFFSGTFSPIGYFIESILGLENVPYLLLPSPFPKENFKLLLAPLISLRLKDRDKTIQEVASFLQSFVQSKIGNFFIYLPSFLYLSKIKPLLSFGEEVDIYYQTESMDSEKKSEFLSHFQENPKKTTVGILVIGGSFGEGVDLPFDRLIGVAIVGTGMPQIGFENELLKSRFKEKGFDYAYRNPGINKVMQAVGRLIRSEKDTGIALLFDDRYTQPEYREIYKRRWQDYEIVTSAEEVSRKAKEFYKG